MSQLYGNTSAPSTEQLPRLARAASENPNNTIHTQHRRQNSLSGRVGTKVVAKSSSTADLPQNLENQQYDPVALPDRITDAGTSMLPCSSRNLHGRNNDEVGNDESRWRDLPGNSGRKEQQKITKDGYLESAIFNSATSGMRSYDEPDHFQHSLARHCHSAIFNTRHAPNNNSALDNSLSDIAISSDISSTESSACPSTVSSPLSTPTRLSPQHELYHPRSNNNQVHQEQPQSTCCQNSIASVNASSPSSSFATSPHNNSQHNYHNHLPEHPNHQQPNTTSSLDTTVVSGNKNFKKFDLRWILLYYRQILPVALCVLSFATVFSILIVYMDTTEIRHQQFRLNMSRDYDLYSVAQDDPQLIAFLREIHMRKYPSHVFRSSPATDDNGLPGGGGIGVGANGNAQRGITPASYLNLSASPDELTPKMAYYVANVMQGKTTGAVIQSLTGPLGHLLTAPWLAETLNWAGMVVEPEPRRYFTLRKQNALQPQLQIIHACVSPNPYPKEVTIHNEEAEVRINSLLDEETSWFNSRVKCFPLYTIMLALNRIEYDLLSLGVHGHELEILQTLPFEKVKIELISIHLLENQEDMSNYIQTITKFLVDKSYKMQKKFGRNYFYQRIAAKTPSNKTQTRTRKKKILLKTP